jgi:aminoglycoside 2''-phosphotransferase
MPRESLVAIETALQRAFPGLAIAPLRQLATGFGSIAVESADGLVFRIARHRGSADGHERELRALPFLHGRLPAAIPHPEWRIEPGEEPFPFGVIGYRKIPGDVLAPARATTETAEDLAAFFAALHAQPVEAARRLRLHPWLGPRAALRWHRDAALPTLRDLLMPGEYRIVAEWWEKTLADDRLVRFRPAVRHGDPWYGNVIVDPATAGLAGVVDWEGVEIGDPAWDAAAQLYLGEDFFAVFLASYRERAQRSDATLADRARRLFGVREFGGVRLAVTLADDVELAEAVDKLRESSILSPAG